jgi:DNA polymerase-3 subunit delta'
MQFKDIIGHTELKEHLKNTVKENRVSHAQLFLGPSGNGALALAIAYAQLINCSAPLEDDSCGTCPNCVKYNKYIHPDLHFSYPFFASRKEQTAQTFIGEWRDALQNNPYLSMDDWRAACEVDNKQANINIAEAHDIIKKLSLKSYESDYKVLIMWLPEYLDKQGNALLKLIEEPPAKTLFILVAENTDRILNTILSRTQLVKIPPYPASEIEKYLLETNGLPQQTAAEIAWMSGGNLALARSLAEEKSESHFEKMVQWLRFCVTDSGKSLIAYSESELSSMGREAQKSFVRYTIQIMRAVLMEKQGLVHLQPTSTDQQGFVQKFAQHYSIDQIDEMVRLLNEAYLHIERNANSKLLFLDLSLQLVLLFKYNTFRIEADSII